MSIREACIGRGESSNRRTVQINGEEGGTKVCVHLVTCTKKPRVRGDGCRMFHGWKASEQFSLLQLPAPTTVRGRTENKPPRPETQRNIPAPLTPNWPNPPQNKRRPSCTVQPPPPLRGKNIFTFTSETKPPSHGIKSRHGPPDLGSGGRKSSTMEGNVL